MTSKKPKPAAVTPFAVNPDGVIAYLSEWLLDIAHGEPVMLSVVLPRIERHAIARFRPAWFDAGTDAETGEPDAKADPEAWAEYWRHEAMYAATMAGSDDTERELSPDAAAAVRVLNACGGLRAALEKQDAEAAAVRALALACELFLAPVDNAERSAQARRAGYLAGAGAASAADERHKQTCIELARERWAKEPELRIGAMVEWLRGELLTQAGDGQKVPKTAAVESWLKNAQKAEILVIPDSASRPGRRKKS
ncbi:hypothetical protein [Cupriavidus oxalaticus]|uniref:Uncharacterized protein n=1 Tax=Cupriavidus oxalaticus TaxID=96344 RepID=A0A5P3VJZ2_9BURK|nr:hypothetical protein [Cupriavidus oxalaticus]QEZ45692.1 hypothetical protein D2917_15305 [Cupriavidus oxalaticus]